MYATEKKITHNVTKLLRAAASMDDTYWDRCLLETVKYAFAMGAQTARNTLTQESTKDFKAVMVQTIFVNVISMATQETNICLYARDDGARAIARSYGTSDPIFPVEHARPCDMVLIPFQLMLRTTDIYMADDLVRIISSICRYGLAHVFSQMSQPDRRTTILRLDHFSVLFHAIGTTSMAEWDTFKLEHVSKDELISSKGEPFVAPNVLP